MIKQTLGFLVLGAATFACSGRYYEVGAMDGAGGAGGTRGAAGGAAPGGSASSTAGAPDVTDPGVGASAGTSNAGPATLACVPPGAPPKLTGPFAEPMVVWQRIALLTTGTPTAPPIALPETTTSAWAGTAVTTALRDAKDAGTAPGVEAFLRQALTLDATAAFEQHWGSLVLLNGPLLNLLLRAPLGLPGRVGIFTEPSWLAMRTTISGRGAGIEEVLFGQAIPPPPEGLENPEPDPNLSDRANLEAAVSSNVPCIACHNIIDPSGFALGHFAADGSYRELDHGLPINTASSRRSEEIVEFDGIADFGEKFENNCEALQGIATTFLRAAVIINAPPEGAQWELVDASIESVQQAFVNSDRTYEALVKAYIQSPAGLRP